MTIFMITPAHCRPPRASKLAPCRTIDDYARAFALAGTLRLARDARGGRCCVAARALASGEFVLAERAVYAAADRGDKLFNALAFATDVASDGSAARRRLLAELCDSTDRARDVAARLDADALDALRDAGADPDAAAWRERVLALMGRYLSNAHELAATDAVGVFPLASMINHDCAPNCELAVDASGVLYVRGARAVAAGEELSYSYIDAADLRKTAAARRRVLSRAFHFRCACARCRAEDAPPAPGLARALPGRKRKR